LIAGTSTLGPNARSFVETGPAGSAPAWRFVTTVGFGGEAYSPAMLVPSVGSLGGLDPEAPLTAAFSFPNPAPPGQNPRFHVEAGIADSVDIRVYNAAGENVHEISLTGTPPQINGVYAYEAEWNVSDAAPGIYRCVVTVNRGGNKQQSKFRLAVVK
jgi:hypothetical protein